MSWSNRCSSIALAVLGYAAQVPASAQSAPIEAARAACSADLQQLCAGVQPGGGRMLACLKEHRDQVSPACKRAVMSALQGSAGSAPEPGGQATSGDTPVSGSSPPASLPAAATPASVAAPASPRQPSARTNTHAVHYFELKRFTTTTNIATSAQDPAREATVYSLLAPADWNLTGGSVVNPDAGSCFSDMIRMQGVVKKSDEAFGMVLLPQSTFRYADDPAIRQQMEQNDRADEKFKLKGCPIVVPIHAADFIRENLVWRFHKDKPPVTAEPFPELEQLVRAELGLPSQGGTAGATRVEAARVRDSTTSPTGAPLEEWWSAVIVVRTFPGAGRGAFYDWHAEQITSFQTPAGKLDGYDKLQRVMATSIRVGPQYQASTTAIINKTYTAWAAEKRKQSAIIAALQQKVIETLQGVTANQQHGSTVAAYGSDQLVRGVQTFRDPKTGHTVELSNLYDHAWSNGNDRYVVTDDPNFNPNGHMNGNWGELQLVRPQP
ncbi:MAG TPA: cysteine rich repeat-containing protein [Acidimicrobiales bacterium]|nr:cysteine rich repeat-containing protein [Acidimicrobiales bacterium]